MPSLSIKVLLADDHQLMVEGFRVALRDRGIEVVDVTYTADTVLQRFITTRPDVLVIDLRFNNEQRHNNLDGLAICEKILSTHRTAKIVVYSQFDDQYIIEKAYKIGVMAFVRKDESSDVLVSAINAANTGKTFLSPAIAQCLAWNLVKEKNPTKILDEKELTAFKLIADGASLTEVAQLMTLSTKTISTLTKSIKHKLDIESQADFTKLAIKFGITNLDMKHYSKT